MNAMRKYSIRTIIFDLDGTLFQTEGVALPAFCDTMNRLREEGLYSGSMPGDDVLMTMFGKTNAQIWAELLPGAVPQIIAKADEYMLYYELFHLKHGKGDPYPGVVETLYALKQRGYRLCIASNGGEGYVNGVTEEFFAGLFEGIYSAGGCKTQSKADLVHLILEHFNDGSAVIVGDRSSDIEAGVRNGLMTIGCTYGFGASEELEDADILIPDFQQMKELFL